MKLNEHMYNINWVKEWPIILNSNLLRVKNLEYKTPMTKTLKLKVTHSLETDKCLSSFSQSASDHKNEASGANIHKDEASSTNFHINETSNTNIYNNESTIHFPEMGEEMMQKFIGSLQV